MHKAMIRLEKKNSISDTNQKAQNTEQNQPTIP